MKAVKYFKRLFLLVLYLSLLLLSSPIAPASAFDGEDVVARVGQEDIVLKTLLPRQETLLERQRALGSDYSQWLLKYAASSLRARLLERYREELQKERGLDPSVEQVQGFVDAVGQIERLEKEAALAEIGKLEAEVTQLQSRDRTKGLALVLQLKEQQLAQLRKQLELLQEATNFSQSHPQLQKQLDQEVAKRFLQSWLIDRELFLQFGGRVAFRYAGPEPIDANLELLKKKQAEHDFLIHSIELEREFWSYFYRDGRALLLPEEDAQALYAMPWWLSVAQANSEAR